jgi:di/tricarboxylate transporter
MILLRVITIDEAYRAVDWRTVFLLAGLIPLGIAMESTGAAAYIASNAVGLIEAAHPILLFLTIGVLSTLFSLFMSNVAATVLLVPLAVSIAAMMHVDPRPLALLVAVCASNSFILPTHQVNALLMAPGGYHNRDYVKAGGLMSVIFLAIAVALTYLFYV